MPLLASDSCRRLTHSLLAAVLVLLPLSPRAADLLELPFQDLLQVEVRSASKRWEQVRDIPASVTIMTREEIARYGYATFEELLKNVPGFFLLDDTSDRFIGNRGTVGGGVQFLVNGVPQHPTKQKALTTPQIARLNIPVESIDRIEVIRGPMSVVYGNNAFLGVINVVTSSIEQNGPRLSASAGTHDSGGLFARAGTGFPDGYVVVNAGVHQDTGLDGDYRDMMGAQQLATVVPGMDDSMDGRMEQRDLSLDFSAGWRGWTADVRYTEKDYGFYIFTPGFDDGNQARLSTWHAALGWEQAFSDQVGLRVNGIFSEETADVDEFDFVSPAVDGEQWLHARRWDLELDFYFDPRPNLNLTTGYRFRLVDGIENRVFIPSLLDVRNRVDDVRSHDLFAELGWSPFEPLRLTGGLRLSRLPASYGYTSEDFLNGTRIEDDFPVDDRNLVTGRVAALWSLDAHQVLKLIGGTAAQDNDQIQFTQPERINTIELNYLHTTPQWTLGASLFRNRISNIVRTIQQLDVNTGKYSSVDDNSGEWLTYGLEMIAEARPLPSLNLAFSATWQQTEDRETGIDPGYSPALLLKLKADYRRGPITYAVYTHYVNGMDADWDFVAGPTPGVTQRIGERVDGYWNVGLNLRYEHPGSGLYANLNASNVLDAEIRYPANQLADFTRGLIGPGRVVTATVGWKF